MTFFFHRITTPPSRNAFPPFFFEEASEISFSKSTRGQPFNCRSFFFFYLDLTFPLSDFDSFLPIMVGIFLFSCFHAVVSFCLMTTCFFSMKLSQSVLDSCSTPFPPVSGLSDARDVFFPIPRLSRCAGFFIHPSLVEQTPCSFLCKVLGFSFFKLLSLVILLRTYFLDATDFFPRALSRN